MPRGMGRGISSGMMGVLTLGSGSITIVMVRARLFTLILVATKGNSGSIRQKERGFILIATDQSMRESGKRMSRRVRVL